MEINKKMDLQVASLKTVLESLKLETVRYLAGKLVEPSSSSSGLFSESQLIGPSLWGQVSVDTRS